jgi:nicotinamide mononucleotide transporter
MPASITEWLSAHLTEVLGAVLGVAYIIFSIRQSILTWVTGLATSVLYIAVFFQAKFYADMGLQFYYVFISIYGWYIWTKGNPQDHNSVLPVSRVKRGFTIQAGLVTLALFAGIWTLLEYYTDSPVPVMDAATTALSITATYMLARKIMEHWLIWIVVDLVSAGLYVYKELWPTAILFLIYTIMAIAGYIQWKKDYLKHQATGIQSDPVSS